MTIIGRWNGLVGTPLGYGPVGTRATSFLFHLKKLFFDFNSYIPRTLMNRLVNRQRQICDEEQTSQCHTLRRTNSKIQLRTFKMEEGTNNQSIKVKYSINTWCIVHNININFFNVVISSCITILDVFECLYSNHSTTVYWPFCSTHQLLKQLLYG